MLRRSLLLLGMIAVVASSTSGQEIADDPRVAAAVNLLELWLDAEQAYKDIPGLSMAIVHDQEIVWRGAFGYADRARMAPATPRTIYSICSISKLFTSIGVMQLRDEGKLHLDDPVQEHLAWFDIEQRYPDSPPITIEGLLTHSAGLPRESDFPYWTPDFDFPTREMIVEKLGSQETLYPASQYFQYSNLGLTLAGEVLAANAGQSYADYVTSNIIQPLGLDDTTPEIPADQRGARFAMGYGSPGREGERSELAFFQVRGIAPAAGFASTVEDLAAFASWQFRVLEGDDDDILSANTLKEMQRVHWVDPDWEVHWGLGFSVWRDNGKTFVGHGGGCPGFRSHFMLQTDEKFAAIVMTNAIDVNSSKYTGVAHQILAPAIGKALDSPDDTTPADTSLNFYAGSYDLAWGGELAVFPWEDGLAMLYLPSDDPVDAIVKLKHVEGHTFRRVRGDDELGEEIVFEVGEDGEITRLIRHSNYSDKIR